MYGYAYNSVGAFLRPTTSNTRRAPIAGTYLISTNIPENYN